MLLMVCMGIIMLNKMKKLITRSLLILILICIVGYFSIANFYKDVFMVNTWINGVYCTGKTVQEVNTELLLKTKAPFLTIESNNGNIGEINMAKAAYSEDYETGLQDHLDNQNVYKWPLYLFVEKNIEILPERTWDEERLKNLVIGLDVVKEECPEELKVDIVLGQNGYELYDNLYEVLQPELLAEYVNQAFTIGETTIRISESNAYEDEKPDKEQEHERLIWGELQEFLNCGIVYDMGAEKITLDKSITSSFVQTDEAGEFLLDGNQRFQVDYEGIDRFIDNLAKEYNTVGTQLAFAATSGKTVLVDYVTYGTELDVEAEKEYLRKAFAEGVSEVHIPTYLKEGYVRGKNDVGDTYIEVDMTAQKLYCYKAGELLLETDIVTGNMRRKWDTPAGVNFVYNKQKKRVLRGPGYATPVDFWMPVKGAIGLHDADWRKEFGGEIYLKNGSHGCVNIPPEIMPTIYEEYEIGTPVIMFY